VQEFDFDSDAEEEQPVKRTRSKQLEKPKRIMPTGADASDGDSSISDEEDGPITISNMEARSRKGLLHHSNEFKGHSTLKHR